MGQKYKQVSREQTSKVLLGYLKCEQPISDTKSPVISHTTRYLSIHVNYHRAS
jgi:hypothetical protein